MQLASCLIYAWPLPTHPRRDQSAVRSWPSWQMIGCCPVQIHCQLMSISALAWGVLLLNQLFWKQCTVRQYRSDLSAQSALEIKVRISVRLRVALF